MGWKPVGFSEIEKFPSQVLDHHYPEVPKLGDMTKYKEWNIEHPDLLVGGTPCQSFSVAGLRKGMDDPRGNLALVYLGIADHFRPRWIVWENVPGVLSSNGGRDFGSFLGALAQLGYGFAYRVLDAQWFGVAQRRRRVFVVGYLGDWRPAAAVLFERQSLCRNSAPSREKREVTPTLTKECTGVSRTGHNEDGWYVEVASTLTKCGAGGNNLECGETYLPVVAPTLNASDGEKWGCNQWVNEGKAILQPIAFHATQDPISGSVSPALGSNMYAGVAQPIPLNTMTMQGRPSDDGRMGSGIGEPGDPCPTLTKAHSHAVAQPVAVDVYNQAIDGDTAATLTQACGGTNTSGPKVMQPIGGVDYENNAHLLEEPTGPLLKGSPTGGGRPLPALVYPMAARRLTPVECERLQGFPDNYTNIRDNCPDGPRYKALGNSMAVPVMRWIGERIEAHPHT
jgi:DNA (cytosine-5)-methyltransferase 1